MRKKPAWMAELRVEHIYPLLWPKQATRTDAMLRSGNPYRLSPSEAMAALKTELKRWSATSASWSTDSQPVGDGINIILVHGDPGVCVRWSTGQEEWELACDRFQSLFANLIAITREITELRQLRKSKLAPDKRKLARQWWKVFDPGDAEVGSGPRFVCLRNYLENRPRYGGAKEEAVRLFKSGAAE